MVTTIERRNLHEQQYKHQHLIKASQNNEDEDERLKKQKTSREKKIEELIDTLAEGGFSDATKERIKAKINTITDDIDDLTGSIKDKETNKLS